MSLATAALRTRASSSSRAMAAMTSRVRERDLADVRQARRRVGCRCG